MVKWYHHVGDFANVFKAFVGTNYLSCAYAFKISGMGFGIVGLLLIAILTDHCCHLLVKCKYAVIDKFKVDYKEDENDEEDERREGNQHQNSLRHHLIDSLDYSDLGYITFGKWGALLINVCLVTTQIGFCVGYFIFIGNTIHSLFPDVIVDVTNTSSSNSAGIVHGAIARDISHAVASVLQTHSQADIDNETLFSKDVHNATSVTMNIMTSPGDVTNSTVTMLPLVELKSTGPSLALMVLVPLPFFLIFTLFRTVRQLSSLSVIANSCVAAGFISILVYLIADFQQAPSITWWEWTTVLVFLSQLTASYEGIGTILPIEASMRENEGFFVPFLHSAVVLLTCMIGVMSSLGYMRYGEKTQQIILQNLPADNPISIALKVLLVLGILCTYPLQVFPVVTVLERLLFGVGSDVHVTTEEGLDSNDTGSRDPLLGDEEPVTTNRVQTRAPTVATWKRNLLRVLLPLMMCGLAVLLRNVFAYTAALVGALGSSPLMFIIPCALHLKLKASVLPRAIIAKDLLIIAFGVVNCVAGTALTIREIVKLA